MNFLKAMFGNYSKREVKRVQPICDKVLALEDKYAAMSESELKNQTTILKERLANGETTDDILPEAFATCREAGWRVLGMKHFPVQIIGGIVLHQGRIAEMKTGEGKTLVATLPAYLNALTGEGVHIVTVNDYLARRDSEWMGKLYRYLGLSVGLICHDLDNDGRKKAYAADITYGTNNELGFDYLRDNMVVYKENKVQRPHAFAIVDEVDSILIDEARTPLIISGKGDKSTDLYAKADAFAKTLKVQRFAELDAKEDMEEYYKENDIDYVVDEKQKTATLTQSGVKKAEEFFGIENLTDPDNLTIQHRERFGKLYPQLETQHPGFIQRVVCDDAYAQSIIDDFKQPDKPPFIAVSVDMMDTGIDVPECVNLVFFKKVRSKTKFWQMIGRGTRLCPSLACVDAIDGEYTGKRRFLIFDYCGNFEFFRQKPNGYESADTKSLSESIFCKQVRIAAALQDGAYGDENYQNWRKILTETCRAEVGALNPELVSVRLHRQAVEHYQKPEAFVSLTETDKGTLMKEVAPLISLDDKDEAAKRFDNFVYGLLLCELEGLPGLGRAQKQLRNTAAMLEGKATIPQVQAKLPLIREVQTDEFLTSHDLLRFEEMRQELRELIKFLVEGGEGQKPVYTALADPVLEQTEGKTLDPGYDFGEYRERVNRYIMEHRSDTLAIHKLTQNIPLSRGDYTELEHIFTCELGSKEDYAREFRDTPFGLLVRKVAKLDHDAAMQAFSKFINDESLNAKQIAFVQKVIHYIEQNGYVESKAVLMKPPFDQPILFTRLFDGKTGSELMETINSVKENATHVTA